jgi:hypothetical protein
MARREEGAYPKVWNRRATKPAGMNRALRSISYFGTTTKQRARCRDRPRRDRRGMTSARSVKRQPEYGPGARASPPPKVPSNARSDRRRSASEGRRAATEEERHETKRRTAPMVRGGLARSLAARRARRSRRQYRPSALGAGTWAGHGARRAWSSPRPKRRGPSRGFGWSRVPGGYWIQRRDATALGFPGRGWVRSVCARAANEAQPDR